MNRLVRLSDDVESYTDCHGMKLHTKKEVAELKNDYSLYQHLLFKGMLIEVKRPEVPLYRCDCCFRDGKVKICKSILHWYAHMRARHKNGF